LNDGVSVISTETRPRTTLLYSPHGLQNLQNGSQMAFLRLIREDEATGALAREYEAGIKRAGKVFNIVKAMSLRPGVLRRSMELYREIMFGPSGLSRIERELLAVVVSRANDCHY
jgi:uncharacterized peroxidase-related enzyme